MAVNIAYRASSTITISPQNIASSTGFTGGVESNVYDNTTNKDVDVLLAGLWTCGTTPTIDTQCRIYVGAPRDDTPTYPDVFDGTGSAETVTSAGVGRGFLRLAATIDIDTTTSDRGYPYGPVSVADLFGGTLPPKFFVFVAHNSGVNSNSTAGNHVHKATGVNYTVS